MRFDGRETVSLDDKGRVPIPRRFRYQLGDPARVVIAENFFGAGPHLVVFPEEVWTELTSNLGAADLLDEDAALANRHILGFSRHAEADGQGRIPIPPKMREAAGLDGEVEWVGANRCMEIWNPARLEEEHAKAKGGLREVLARVAARRQAAAAPKPAGGGGE